MLDSNLGLYTPCSQVIQQPGVGQRSDTLDLDWGWNREVISLLIDRNTYIARFFETFDHRYEITMLHSHYQINDTASFAEAIIVSQVLNIIHFKTGCILLSKRWYIHSRVRIFPCGRYSFFLQEFFNTDTFYIIYRHSLLYWFRQIYIIWIL